jgi:hypothetical protein
MPTTTQTISRIPGNTQRFDYVLRQNPPAPVSFTATATTQSYTIFGLPAQSVVVGVMVKLVTEFAGSGLSSANVTIGATDNIASTSVANYYAPAFGLVQTVSPKTFMYWTPFSSYTENPHDVTATVNTFGAQLASLTAGEILITVLWRSV